MRIKVQVTSQNSPHSSPCLLVRTLLAGSDKCISSFDTVPHLTPCFVMTNEDYWNQESSEICDLLIEKRRLLENEEKVQLELSLGGVTEYSSYHTDS
jgi:hypothetical protein